MREWQRLSAITQVRKAAMDTVVLCDMVIFGTGTEVDVARARLPRRLRRLRIRAAQALRALGEEGR
jgi:hypothetical protein